MEHLEVKSSHLCEDSQGMKDDIGDQRSKGHGHCELTSALG